MNKIVLCACVALLAASFAFGQADKGTKAPNATVEQTLRKIEQECADALVKGDATIFDRNLADTCSLTNSDGTVWDKPTFLATLKSGDLKFESSKIDQMKVQIYGSAAVVIYRTTDKGAYKGQDVSGQTQWTDTFVKTGGRWQIVADHGSHIAQ